MNDSIHVFYKLTCFFVSTDAACVSIARSIEVKLYIY